MIRHNNLPEKAWFISCAMAEPCRLDHLLSKIEPNLDVLLCPILEGLNGMMGCGEYQQSTGKVRANVLHNLIMHPCCWVGPKDLVSSTPG